MHTADCYHCGSRDHAPYLTENGFTLVRCRGCGLLFVTPRPDDAEIAAAVRLGLHRGESDLHVTGVYDPTWIPFFRRVLRDLYGAGLPAAGGAWLDIGCGHGEFLEAVQGFGAGRVRVRGVEPNEGKQRSARSRGLDVSLFDLEAHGGSYDFLSLMNVYSHLPDPPAAIRSWTRLLKPGGEFLLQTGDSARFEPRDQYRPLGLPDHLSFVSEAILRELLGRCGFEVLAVRKYLSTRWTPATIARELLAALRPGTESRLRHLLRHRDYRTNMFVRARLIS